MVDMNIRAKNVCAILNKLPDNEFIKAPLLQKELADRGITLTLGQLQGVVTYIKDCSRFVDYERYRDWFVISSRDGYALLKKVDAEHIGKCYKKLLLSARAEEQRIKPLLLYLEEINFDFESIELNESDFSEYEIERMREFSNWNYSEDDKSEDDKSEYESNLKAVNY